MAAAPDRYTTLVTLSPWTSMAMATSLHQARFELVNQLFDQRPDSAAASVGEERRVQDRAEHTGTARRHASPYLAERTRIFEALGKLTDRRQPQAPVPSPANTSAP